MEDARPDADPSEPGRFLVVPSDFLEELREAARPIKVHGNVMMNGFAGPLLFPYELTPEEAAKTARFQAVLLNDNVPRIAPASLLPFSRWLVPPEDRDVPGVIKIPKHFGTRMV